MAAAKDAKSATNENKPGADKKPISATADAAKFGKKGVRKGEEKPGKGAKQRIRSMLALHKMDEIRDKVKAVLSDYKSAWSKYDADHMSNPDAVKPTPPDFKALAKQYGLIADDTGLITYFALDDLEMAKSYSQDLGRYFSFKAIVTGSQRLYQPQVTEDVDKNYFIFWVTELQKEHVPKFTDPGIADQVKRTLENAGSSQI